MESTSQTTPIEQVLNVADSQICELGDLQLAVVGGGIGDVIVA